MVGERQWEEEVEEDEELQRERILNQLEKPAVALIGVGGLSTVCGLNGLGSDFSGVAGAAVDEPAAGLVFALINIAAGFFVAYGGWQMKQGGDYRFAIGAAIVACIPCIADPCCAIGLPFGIWSLVLLVQSDTRAAFSNDAGMGFEGQLNEWTHSTGVADLANDSGAPGESRGATGAGDGSLDEAESSAGGATTSSEADDQPDWSPPGDDGGAATSAEESFGVGTERDDHPVDGGGSVTDFGSGKGTDGGEPTASDDPGLGLDGGGADGLGSSQEASDESSGPDWDVDVEMEIGEDSETGIGELDDDPFADDTSEEESDDASEEDDEDADDIHW